MCQNEHVQNVLGSTFRGFGPFHLKNASLLGKITCQETIVVDTYNIQTCSAWSALNVVLWSCSCIC